MKIKRKRKSPIAKSLINNSKSAMLSAIEIHNKPTFSYRYEVVVLLALNAWELMLKSYIYKFHKKIKIFKKDGSSKPFLECVSFVHSQLGNDFLLIKENLEKLYEYRNHVAHFYSEKLDIVIFALLKKNVEFYQDFLLKYYKLDLSSESDLVLLPIGFKKPYSPFDFLSNKTTLKNSSIEVKSFIKSIIDSTKKLDSQGIQDSILADFKVNLINEKRTKNADIIAGINNKTETGIDITVVNPTASVQVSDDPTANKVILTRDKEGASGIFLQEVLSKDLFHEINNVIDANNLLSSGDQEWFLGERVYYRIYAERHHVSYNVNNFELLAQTGLELYGPFLFWFSNLPPKSCANIIVKYLSVEKNLQMNAIIRLAVLLGSEITNFVFNKLDEKYKNYSQPPNYYWNIKRFLEESWEKDLRLKALKKSNKATLPQPNDSKSYEIINFIENKDLVLSKLQSSCTSVFTGQTSLRNNCRILDILAYGEEINKKSNKIISEGNLIKSTNNANAADR